MRRFTSVGAVASWVLCAWVLAAGAARAQGDADAAMQEYASTFERGIDALTNGDNDAGIAAFERCLELRPEEPTCAYNVACGHAKKGEADAAFVWLGKAADWGFGNQDGASGNNIDWTRQDADLESLRADPRFEEIVGRMERAREVIATYVAAPAIHVPEALADAESVGVLVVLHPAGATKDQTLERWRALGDELGLAVVAPSGTLAIGLEPAQGMAWFGDPQAFGERYWIFEKPIHDAVSAFQKQHAVDKSRVFLLGEEMGGLVAFNAAVGSPGLYKGVVVVDSPVHLQLAQAKGANAGKMGVKARIVVDDAIAADPQAAAVFDATRRAFTAWTMDGTVTTYAGAAARDTAIADAVQSLK